jgi:hypothetical protein
VRRILFERWGIEFSLQDVLVILVLIWLISWGTLSKHQIASQLNEIVTNTKQVPVAIEQHNADDLVRYDAIKARLAVILQQNNLIEKELKTEPAARR